MAYVPIKLGGRTGNGNEPEPLKLSFKEDEQINEPKVEQLAPEIENKDNDDANRVAPSQEKPKASLEANERKPSRAVKRIHQLNDEKRELAEQLEAERAEKEQLRLMLQKNAKGSEESLKTTLEGKVSLLSQQLAKAIQEGEAEQAVAIQNDLMDTKNQLSRVYEKLEKHIEFEQRQEEAKKVQKPKQVQKVEISERTQDWIDAHPQFKEDEVFNAAALAVNAKLLREGFDPDSEDFWEELDERLSPRFPEVFGIVEKKSVSSKKNTVEHASKEDPQDDKDEEVIEPEHDEDDEPSNSHTRQTVSGASRTPVNQKQPRNSDKVTLTTEDVRQAERWGITLEQMARRMQHMDKNRRIDGYVPIMIPTKAS